MIHKLWIQSSSKLMILLRLRYEYYVSLSTYQNSSSFRPSTFSFQFRPVLDSKVLKTFGVQNVIPKVIPIGRPLLIHDGSCSYLEPLYSTSLLCITQCLTWIIEVGLSGLFCNAQQMVINSIQNKLPKYYYKQYLNKQEK